MTLPSTPFASTASRFYVRSRGQISGPLSLDDVARMVRTPNATKHYELSEDRVHWIPLGTKLANLKLSSPAANEQPHSSSQTLSCRESTLAAQVPLEPYVPPRREETAQAATSDEFAPGPLVGSIFRNRSTPWILAFGVGPLIFGFLQLFIGLRFVHTAWLFSAYFCVLWAWILGTLTTEGNVLWRRGTAYAVFTAFIGTLMLLLWQNIPVIALLYSGLETTNPAGRFLGFVLGVGLFEELCKAAPLLLFGLQSQTIRSEGAGLFLGMMSGLGFAVSEGVEYTIKYWSSAVGLGEEHVRECIEQATTLHGSVNQDVFLQRLGTALPAMFEQYGLFVVAQLTRFMSLPLLHAAWAGLVGFGIGKAFGAGQWRFLFGLLALAALLHGAYNFFLPGVISVAVAALSISLALALIIKDTAIDRTAP